MIKSLSATRHRPMQASSRFKKVKGRMVILKVRISQKSMARKENVWTCQESADSVAEATFRVPESTWPLFYIPEGLFHFFSLSETAEAPVFKYLNTYCVQGRDCFASHDLFIFTPISCPSLCSALHIKTPVDFFLGSLPVSFVLKIGEKIQAISPVSSLFHVLLHPYSRSCCQPHPSLVTNSHWENS